MTVDTTTADSPRTPTQMLAEVHALNAAALRLETELRDALTAAVRRVVAPGVRLDLRQRYGLPECLWSVVTSHGNDRGTRLFEITSEPRVQVKLESLALSTWSCEAKPISETTGKPMSGRTANGSDRDTITLRGHLIDPNMSALIDDAPSEDVRWVAFLSTTPVPGMPTVRTNNDAPSKAKTSNVQAAMAVLLDAGFVPDGTTRTDTVRVPTQASPVYGGSGGELATFGGRQRLARGMLKATVGPRTVALYRRDGAGLAGTVGIATLRTGDLDGLRAALERTLADESAPHVAVSAPTRKP